MNYEIWEIWLFEGLKVYNLAIEGLKDKLVTLVRLGKLGMK